jgi:hypothetical protein
MFYAAQSRSGLGGGSNALRTPSGQCRYACARKRLAHRHEQIGYAVTFSALGNIYMHLAFIVNFDSDFEA